jgi:superfamily I DNA and/or RNA helicase
MTISGSAIYKNLLDALECPIIIIEEAGQVLENHMIPILNKHSKHLILVGDH